MQDVYIDLGLSPPKARAAVTGSNPPRLAGILGTNLDIVVRFFRDGVVESIPEGTTGGRLTLKKKGARSGDPLLLDTEWTAEGEGESATYTFEASQDTDELIAALGEKDSLAVVGNIEWLLAGDTEKTKCSDFSFIIENSSSRPEDSTPSNSNARWEWLKAAAPEDQGFTHHDDTQTLEVEAGGGAPDAHAATHAAAGSDPVTLAQSQITGLVAELAAKATQAALATLADVVGASDAALAAMIADKADLAALAAHTGNTSNPHAVTKAQVGLSNADNTSDASKPVSTAQQTALDAKVATSRAVNTQHSLAGGGSLAADRTLSLVNDAASPGNDKVYGTNASGVKGWKDDPAGGGSALLRATGLLQGHTSPEVPASAPPEMTFTVDSLDQEFTFTITFNGTPYDFTVSTTDPTNGTTWIDSNAFAHVNDVAAGMATGINSLALGGLTCGTASDMLTLTNSNTGAAATLSGSHTNYGGNNNFVGGGSGADSIPASGAISEVELIPVDGSKKTFPVRVGWSGAGLEVAVQVCLKNGGTYQVFAADIAANETNGEAAVAQFYQFWIDGYEGASLVARMTTTPPTGGDLTIWAIGEQHA